MQAVRFHAHGGPDVLTYEDAPDPAVAPGGVVVRVRACALNHLDLWQRRGIERVTIPMPHISGADVAGEIVEVGEGVEGLAVGTRVMLQPGLSCGQCRWCLAGLDNRCGRYDVLGYQSPGGYAERVAVPAANVIRLPDHVDFVSAAAFPLTFLTAWHMLLTRATLTERDTVLVVAAGSGVGQAAVQIARRFGARVIATAGGQAKLAQAKALGADEVIDHYAEDVVARVRAVTNRAGVDIVVEHVGGATWDRSVRCLARGGRLVICGATSGHHAALDLRHLFARQLSLLGSYMGTKAELLRVAELFFAGHVRPVIDRTLPLSEAGQAHARLESGSQFGKIVLEV
ncbi:MAG TPA: zinc-binding dehydrogenase [Vicinamibacterales bacterium]|nr:zinc-binding dehydrogenase [Vicinamibacterales bacterium]